MNSLQITLGDSNLIPNFETGVIHVCIPNGKNWTKVTLHNVLYVLDLYRNLLSISQITEHEAKVQFLPHSCSIYSKSEKLISKGTRYGRLFTIIAYVIHPLSACVELLPSFPDKGDSAPNITFSMQTSSVITLHIWH